MNNVKNQNQPKNPKLLERSLRHRFKHAIEDLKTNILSLAIVIQPKHQRICSFGHSLQVIFESLFRVREVLDSVGIEQLERVRRGPVAHARREVPFENVPRHRRNEHVRRMRQELRRQLENWQFPHFPGAFNYPPITKKTPNLSKAVDPRFNPIRPSILNSKIDENQK